MDETQIMTALTTGLIGLFGVILGGIISAYSQRRNNIEQRVHEIRERCAALAKSASDYSATLAQFVRERHEDKTSPGTPDSDASGVVRDSDYWNRIGGKLFDSFNETIAISLQVAATKDHRVGRQAQEVRLKVIEAHNEVSPVFMPFGSAEPARAEELRDKVNEEAEILLNMVQPGWAESFWRFRGRKAAIRLRVKERKKEGISGDREENR